MKTFDHIGIPTTTVQPGSRFVEKTRVHVTDPHAHPFAVEWLRYEADSPVIDAIRKVSHVAFRVDSIEQESDGLRVLIPPFSSVPGHRVAFFETQDGAIVELMEFTE